MTRWVLSIEAANDLDRLVDFLLASQPLEAVRTNDLITDALSILERHPMIGRPIEQGLRELVISRGNSGYLALYQYDESADAVIVLAVRPGDAVDFEPLPDGRVAISPAQQQPAKAKAVNPFRKFLGIGIAGLSTEEILRETRGEDGMRW